MKAHEALIAWTPADADNDPTAGMVKVGPLLNSDDKYDWTDPYAMTGGAAFVERRIMRSDKALAALFIEFNTIVVGDGINPKVAHQAFLNIDEYAEAISPDIPGGRKPKPYSSEEVPSSP